MAGKVGAIDRREALRALAAMPAALFAARPAISTARTLYADPSNYRKVLGTLQPGDHLRLSSGTYRRGLPLHRLQGTAEAPIVVSGPATGAAAVFQARSGANTVSLLDVAHLEVRNLELDGRHLPVDAVKAEGHGAFAHYVTLAGLTIHSHDASQQNVGISTKCPALGWQVRDNRLFDVGTGMYLGDSDGSAPFVGGLIVGNEVSRTTGYNLQVKHQTGRETGSLMPTHPMRTVITNNVFIKSAASATGDRARPNVLVGHLPAAGPGADDLYLMYDNVFYANPAERLFQGEGNLAVYNNLFVNPLGDGVAIQPHNDIPKKIWLFHNTIVAAATGLYFAPVGATETAEIMGNAIFGTFHHVEGGRFPHNHIGPYRTASDMLVSPHSQFPDFDLHPKPGRLTASVGWAVPSLPDVDKDFEGEPRSLPVYGALLPRRA